jgi:hypothetical protein
MWRRVRLGLTQRGRLIALPLVLLALFVQGLAPGVAGSMSQQTGPLGLPICTAHDVGSHARHAPPTDRGHDCCAEACALAGLAAAPTAPIRFDRAHVWTGVAPLPTRQPATLAAWRRKAFLARGPPGSRSI